MKKPMATPRRRKAVKPRHEQIETSFEVAVQVVLYTAMFLIVAEVVRYSQ